LNHAIPNQDNQNFLNLYINDADEARRFMDILEKESLNYTREVLKMTKFKDKEQVFANILKVKIIENFHVKNFLFILLFSQESTCQPV
jgi:hypothetical protein